MARGLPGAGKSTWSKQWVDENAKTRIRVNRDDIRRMLGPYWIPTREKLVTSIEDSIIKNALELGYSIVIDATNFRSESKFQHLSRQYNCEFELKDFSDVSVETCVERDSMRPKEEQVGRKVIEDMFNRYYW